MRITKAVARIVKETATPIGEPGILVQCDCGGHRTGNKAILRMCDPSPALIHGNVNAAFHPYALAGAASIRKNGPWAVREA